MGCLAVVGFAVGCGAAPGPPAQIHDSEADEPIETATIAPFAPERFDADGVDRRPQLPPNQSRTPPKAWGQCLRSRLCELEGLCSPGPDSLCIAESDDDCRPSDACLGGRCSAKEGRCVAATDDDCKTSWACKGYGRCYHDGDEACMAKSEEDCRASTRCQREGECSLSGGECVAGAGR